MTKTFKDMVNHSPLADGTLVNVEIPDLYSFDGKIVGVGTDSINPMYLVECTDGFLPNDTYQYKVCGMPLSYISER